MNHCSFPCLLPFPIHSQVPSIFHSADAATKEEKEKLVSRWYFWDLLSRRVVDLSPSHLFHSLSFLLRATAQK